MTICVSAPFVYLLSPFPDYIYPRVATSLSLLFLPYIPCILSWMNIFLSNMLFNFCVFLFLKETFFNLSLFSMTYATDFFSCKYHLLG